MSRNGGALRDIQKTAARATSHFVDGWHLPTKSVKSASSPTPSVVDYVAFVGETGMGVLVWVRIFLKIITIITILSYLGEQPPTADRIVDRTYILN